MKTPLVILALIIAGALIIFLSRGASELVFEAQEENDTEDQVSSLTPRLMDQLTLTSHAFEDNETIPAVYTCDGENVHPDLSISGVADEAQSLALIMDDPDVPREVREDQLFVHWVVYDIPPTVTEIPEGIETPGVLGSNGAGNTAYTGPCPPREYEPSEHRYFFKVYALDTLLNLDPGATKEEVEEAMRGHVLQKGELVGRYKRP